MAVARICDAEWRSSSSGDMDMALFGFGPAYDCRAGESEENLRLSLIKISEIVMKDDLKTLLTNPEVFPVEITLSSGDKIRITHPDYVHYSQKMGQIFFYPQDEHGVFEMIVPEQIAKVRARVKRRAA